MRVAVAGGGPQRRRRHQTFTGERRLARREVYRGQSCVPGGDQGTQEQLLRILVQWVEAGGVSGCGGGRLGVALSQQAQRPLAQFLHRTHHAPRPGQ
jgi:hypothetical protein